MTSYKDTKRPSSTEQEDSEQKQDSGIVIEASWAPQDPRDKLYDSTATEKERAASLLRIIAAFHPVMNAPVLCYDFFKLIGIRWTLVILAAALAGIGFLFFR